MQYFTSYKSMHFQQKCLFNVMNKNLHETIKRRNNKCMGCVYWCEHMECNLAFVQIGDLADLFHPSFSWASCWPHMAQSNYHMQIYIWGELNSVCMCVCKQANTEMLMKQDQQQKLQIKQKAPISCIKMYFAWCLASLCTVICTFLSSPWRANIQGLLTRPAFWFSSCLLHVNISKQVHCLYVSMHMNYRWESNG